MCRMREWCSFIGYFCASGSENKSIVFGASRLIYHHSDLLVESDHDDADLESASQVHC